MHLSSMEKMRQFRQRYLGDREEESLVIYDIGSLDVNGSYREFFLVPAWRYIGVDIEAGPNVDIVLDDPYAWRIPSRSADVVITGQALEHVEFPWLSVLELARILRPGGLCCLVVPAGGFEHRYPLDCWRYYPDGLAALARYAGLELLSAATEWSGTYADQSEQWRDSVLVARRPGPERSDVVSDLARRALVGLSKRWIRRSPPVDPKRVEHMDASS